MTGVLNLYKPSGPTSHDVVARVRRLLGVRRVGHAGTLDPMARGVLVVCVGSATRIVEYFAELPKEYRARMTLGVETDTQDITGRVLVERDAAHLGLGDVRAVLPRFRGEILQTPPMVSAVKHAGRRLYQLARAGQEVERAPRRVTVYALECLEFQPGPRPTATLVVTCSGGTYVRTLCAEIGAALGVGGMMSELERTAIGPFRAEESRTLEELEPLAAENRVEEALIAPAGALAHLPAVAVDEAGCKALAQGKMVVREELTSPPNPLPEAGRGSLAGKARATERETDEFAQLPLPVSGRGLGGEVNPAGSSEYANCIEGEKGARGRGPAPLRVLGPTGELVAIGRIDVRDGQSWLAPEKVFGPVP